MNAASQTSSDDVGPAGPRVHLIAGKVLLHCVFVLIAVIAYVAYEHFKLHGRTGQSLVSLIVAGGLGFAPLRAVAHAFFALEGKVLHAIHGAGAVALIGLTFGGVISGTSLLPHAAMAPFAIMGAAQALMHQDHPRNPAQAQALHNFASSLPEVAQFTQSRDLTSAANVRRAVAVINDLLTKAQILGQTELQSDPSFQGALRRITTRYGLDLGLDALDRAISRLSANPSASGVLPQLRKQLANARKTADKL